MKFKYNPVLKSGLDRTNGGGSTSGDVLTLKGNWDADTNTPELLDGNGSEGDLYIVSVAGSTPLTTSKGVYDNWQIGQEVYKTSSGSWDLIPDSRNVYDGSGDDTVTKGDIRAQGDVYADGEYFAQQNSTIYANNIKVGVTGDKLVITDVETEKQSLIARNEIDSGASTGTKDIFRYAPFTKSDPLGQLQPDDSLTFNSTSFVEDLTGDTKYYYQVTLPASNKLVTDIWYFRSLTGLDNSYIYVYKGAVDFSTLTGQQDTKCWASNTPKEIRTKTNLVNDAGGSGVDIEYKLGNTFFEKPGDIFTYVFVCDNNFTTQGQTYTGVDVPYIKGDGAKWGVVNTSSKVIINGNLSPNEFNGTLQINNNSTEYYGCSVNLDAGIYDKVDLPYKNGVLTSGNGNIYVVILDQNDNTLLYKRELVPSLSTEGTLVIDFDEDLLLETSGIYQIVIGRRNWNGNARRVELFHKDVNSSDGSVWVAYSGSNPALNVGDTSGVDWSTIQKQNFNRIPKALIYKF